jgi:hypothetical protein
MASFKEDPDAIVGYARKVQHVLGLRDWQISIIFVDSIDEDNSIIATVDYEQNRRTAPVYIRRDIDEKDLRPAIVHELLHLVMVELWEIVDDIVKEKKLRDMIYKRIELSIGRLEDPIADLVEISDIMTIPEYDIGCDLYGNSTGSSRYYSPGSRAKPCSSGYRTKQKGSYT